MFVNRSRMGDFPSFINLNQTIELGFEFSVGKYQDFDTHIA